MSTSKTELFEGADPQAAALPANLGRYRIMKELGRGGFGRVYLAHDELLKRQVAVKLLHLRSSSAALVPSLLAEARTIAQMNHPGILPIFDAMETDEGEFCIVSPFVEGKTLRQKLLEKPFSHLEAATLAARVCDALHHAHKRGVVHRDVKPANIMLGADGMPVLLDFGLAKSLQEVVKDRTVAGTPGYMSPEQARGEDHLVNGRSDIFSLGAVFYEMLTSRRAFQVSSIDEQLRRVAAGEPVAPRDAVPAIPKELSRICMKALNPQMRWRYPVAVDMAEDLNAWIETLTATVIETPTVAAPKPGSVATARSEQVRVVPRGLRAFDEGDSEFFLKLVPGPRDQYGLPESLRFWKQRIESSDPRLAFRAGVIYGPSGCGKSSLVGAGLLPRCASHVKVIFHEARHAGNAVRLARALHAEFPALDPANPHPPDLIHQLRTGGMLFAPQKLLLVIDQTEQWLRACETSESEEGGALLNTLRQCDGIHVQALLLVRDDFWRGVSRLLAEADVEILSNNSALVDLFEPRHAEFVLESFGRAYQCLPEDPGVALTQESRAFIHHAVHHLSEGGKISPVRLALFTEMFRSRPWTLASLREVGGASGVAVAFLEDVFRGPSASGPRRVHEQAARKVFEELVPAAGDVRGPACRQAALLEVSGYAGKPGAFQELLNLLDAELRLLTPVDPDDAEGEPAWQLTHDYMVPALRHWLLAQKTTTRRGRAEVALAERAREWSQRRDRTRLPGFWEWLRLRLLTRRAKWSLGESEWMQAGMRRVSLVGVCALLVVGVASFALEQWRASVSGRALAERILSAAPEDVAAMTGGGPQWESWTKPLLEQRLADSVSSPAGRNARLALVRTNRTHVETLAAAMIDSDARTFGAVRKALAGIPNVPLAIFRQTLDAPEASNGRKLRAAAALAAFAKDDPRITQFAPEAGRWLVTSVDDVAGWATQIQPIAGQISPPLEKMLSASEPDAHNAAIALAALHAGDKTELIRLLQVYPPAEIPSLVTALAEHRDAGNLLLDALTKVRGAKAAAGSPGKDSDYTSECNLALAALSLGMGEHCWLYFSREGNPVLRAEVTWQASAAGVPAEILVSHLTRTGNAGERQGLLLALHGYSLSALRALVQQEIIQWLPRALATDPDGGVHSAVITLMKHWSLDRQIVPVVAHSTAHPPVGMNWWTTPSGVDMRIIVLPDGRRVALGACEVTVEEFKSFRPVPKSTSGTNTEAAAPVIGLSWTGAIEYCNALSAREGLGPENLCYFERDGEWEAFPDALQRKGYRLPTKEEWLVGAEYEKDSHTTPISIAQIPRYGWIAVNAGDRPRPVGRLLPNEHGLWDTYGNAAEWVHDRSIQGGDAFALSVGSDFSSVAMGLLHFEAWVAGPKFGKPRSGLRLARSLGSAP